MQQLVTSDLVDLAISQTAGHAHDIRRPAPDRWKELSPPRDRLPGQGGRAQAHRPPPSAQCGSDETGTRPFCPVFCFTRSAMPRNVCLSSSRGSDASSSASAITTRLAASALESQIECSVWANAGLCRELEELTKTLRSLIEAIDRSVEDRNDAREILPALRQFGDDRDVPGALEIRHRERRRA